jgi:hypothetical protein
MNRVSRVRLKNSNRLTKSRYKLADTNKEEYLGKLVLSPACLITQTTPHGRNSCESMLTKKFCERLHRFDVPAENLESG